MTSLSNRPIRRTTLVFLLRYFTFCWCTFNCEGFVMEVFSGPKQLVGYVPPYFVCEIISPPFLHASPIFPLRGLFVEVMPCWCLWLSLGPYCWCFFPHTHTQTCTQWALTADTQLHSLLQLHLLSPWRPCLLLNPPSSQARTLHTHIAE